MPNFLSPIGNDQLIDSAGDPLTGGQIETYLENSSTPAATFTSSSGAVAQSNPIILNSLGSPASPIWLTGGVSYKFIIKNAAGVTLRTIDNIAGINDAAVSLSEWVESGLVPTFINSTSFSVPGDQTPTLQVNRRLRTTNTSGLVYSTISAASFGLGITTVTVINDSTALDSGLSLVAYALLAASPSSSPKPINPAFAAAQAVGQTVASGNTTVCQYATETFDTTSAYNTGTYRYTPQAAGYYQVSASVSGAGATTTGRVFAAIRKNGTPVVAASTAPQGNANAGVACVSGLVSLNGTTDYIDITGAIEGTGTLTLNGAAGSNGFSAFLVQRS